MGYTNGFFLLGLMVLSYLVIFLLHDVISETLVWGSQILLPISFIGVFVGAIYAVINENILRKKIIADLISPKLHFDEFCEIFKSERWKGRLKLMGSIAIGLIATAVSVGQKSYERTRQEEMVRRLVDNDLNRERL